MAISIVQGENSTVIVRVTDKATNELHPFEGFEGATAYFSKEDDTAESVTGSVLQCGKLMFPMSTTQTDGLKTGEELDFEYRWRESGNLYIEQVLGQLEVVPRLFD